MRILIILALGSVPLAAQPAGKVRYDHGDPTALEQWVLEMVNRTRADPAGEAGRFGVDLNQGLAANTLTPAAKAPLAFNPDLLAAARKHSRWMLAGNTFSHTGEGGSNAGDRMADAGYFFLAPYLWGENIGWQGNTLPKPAKGLIGEIHRKLFLSPGHRSNLLEPDHDEVGIGLVYGKFVHNGLAHRAWMLTENFARSSGSPLEDGPFVLGVVYADRNGNGLYDPGEGRSGVTVIVEPGQHYAVSSASGGYAIPLGKNPPAAVTVAASEPGQPEISRRVQLPAGKNIKVDVLWPGSRE